MKVKRALVSVSNKDGIVEFAGRLSELGIEIVSTGGTSRSLATCGVACREVSDLTGAPEILNGRVKTLHPRIHGAILCQPEKPSHAATLEAQGIERIDMVVVNLYPFQKVAAAGAALDEALEQIDIGGVALLRAASKNFANVVVVSSPEQYPWVAALLAEHGDVPEHARRRLAVEAFAVTRDYDRAIHRYLATESESSVDLPACLALDYEKVQELRYGENPHQRAALYTSLGQTQAPSVVGAEQLSGKELSYNNYLDLDAALAIVREFQDPAAAILKHATPCGVAMAPTPSKAYERALACDPVSAFGCVIAVNRSVDQRLAELIHETHFVEAVIAPDYYRSALDLMTKKQNRRILRATFPDLTHYAPRPERQVRSLVGGGLLVQDLDTETLSQEDLRVVSERKPTKQELDSLIFAWRVVKHVRSNAIVIARDTETVGIGSGQMSRVDSSVLAVWKAGERVKGSVMASDGFFPMRDAVDAAAEAGVTAIIQPGGSKGDDDSILAANERNVAMVMTGRRHFRH
ncbi:MAG: bifunctional phosphoribosylaminoimidazolecarboxamide formyltransferase/IMP cyclohydrolase [Candidatus Eisenbacteria bacterium]|nr:bifunctional phosphoribosylaminoimidazolecarboxamide formyltransferase/IMP cyclohydrolase [Candidatus Eisenbacteria bacterium]